MEEDWSQTWVLIENLSTMEAKRVHDLENRER